MNERTWFKRTRQVGFLWKSSAALMGIMLVLGIAISFLNANRMHTFQDLLATPVRVDEFELELDPFQNPHTDSNRIVKALAESLSSESPFYEKLEEVSFLLYYFPPHHPITLPPLGTLSAEQQRIAAGLTAACAEPESAAAFRPLEMLAASPNAPPDANYAVALALENRETNMEVIEALLREIDLHSSPHARERLVGAFLRLKKYDALEALGNDPEFKEFITPNILQEIARARSDWPNIVKYHFASAYGGMHPTMALLALLSGLVWAIILIRFNGSFSNVWIYSVPALVLGALSAHATLFCIFWLEGRFGMAFGTQIYQQLIYCLGIGLREEGMKLLLFVPLIPFLWKRTDLEILTVAGLVGLGFAMEENINYFEATAGLGAMARFATANFLHLALTAMCGLTLTRALVHRGEDIQHALVTFVLAVAIHSFYNAFLMVPAWVDYSWLTYTVFVLMGYQYFGWLRHLRDEWNDPISITATFTYGIILVTGFTFILAAWDLGPVLAIQAVVGEAIGIAIILVLFYREIPETIE
ncbi:MAG: PrsW family glutamic-type intramembrane protease [Pontiella sp.]